MLLFLLFLLLLLVVVVVFVVVLWLIPLLFLLLSLLQGVLVMYGGHGNEEELKHSNSWEQAAGAMSRVSYLFLSKFQDRVLVVVPLVTHLGY